MVDREALGGVELFSSFSDDEIDLVSRAAHQLELERGDQLFVEGDDADSLYVVREGRVAMAIVALDGRESVVALMEPGDLFGEMGLFGDGLRSADARALEASVVVRVGYDVIRGVYDTRPELLWDVVTLLSDRLRDTDEALADAVFLDVTGRTAKRLLDMAGDEDEFTLPITQEELAGMVGASRERVNKAIAAFLKLGWLEQDGDTYRVTNREQMEIRAR